MGERSEGKRIINDLLRRPENRICADCKAKQSEWASTTLGVFVCIDCSGIHRSLGAHITFVRSCTLDSWTVSLAQHMAAIGNSIGNSYWEANLPEGYPRPEAGNLSQITQFIRQKYVNRKWAAKGPSPNEILLNKQKQVTAQQQQVHLRKRHTRKKEVEEQPQSLADRIRSLKNKNQHTPQTHHFHREISHTPPASEPAPIKMIEPPKIIQETRSIPIIKEIASTTANSSSDEDDFFNEPKPMSAAAKAIMSGSSPSKSASLNRPTQASQQQQHRQRTYQKAQAKPALVFHKPEKTSERKEAEVAAPKEVMRKRLDRFFEADDDVPTPSREQPRLIGRSMTRRGRIQQDREAGHTRLSARLVSRMERRKKELPVQRGPRLKFSADSPASDAEYSESDDDPFA